MTKATSKKSLRELVTADKAIGSGFFSVVKPVNSWEYVGYLYPVLGEWVKGNLRLLAVEQEHDYMLQIQDKAGRVRNVGRVVNVTNKREASKELQHIMMVI